MEPRSVFTEFVRRLEVPCTADYSDSQFASMPFCSLFGFSRLLQKYGIPNDTYRLADKAQAESLPVPYLAQYGDTFVVVTDSTPGQLGLADGERTATLTRSAFDRKFTGVVLLAYPEASSREPDYERHRFIDAACAAKRWILAACVVFMAVYFIVVHGLWRSPALIAVLAIDSLGLYASYLLILKSVGIETQAGDSICGIIERTGCHSVLNTAGAKFFGIFGWSEVGFGYFGVSIACLLLFPQYVGYLALANACAALFSFWSIWYQKYRAKAWCTLCLTVQGCLWGALIAYLLGGAFAHIGQIGIEALVLLAAYVGAVLAAQAVADSLEHYVKNK